MYAAHILSGSAVILKKFKLGATVATAGIPVIADLTNDYGEVIPATTTSMANTPGLGIDTGTYSATQGQTEGVVTVIVNPDLVVRSRLSGGATEGTNLVLLSNTSANGAGTTITDGDVGTASTAGGIVWCLSGNNVGLSRVITTFNSGANIVVTVPFPRTIAVGDTFVQSPLGRGGSGGNMQLTSAFYETDNTIVVGNGGEANFFDLEMNGVADSYILFLFNDHLFGQASGTNTV